MAEKNDFSHDAGNYGENLYMSWSSKSPDLEDEDFGKIATDNWYDEINLYDFSHPGFSSGTGHFTQVVWKDTTKLGCAASKSKSTNNIYVVCNYNKPGNFLGRYEQNVFPPN